MTTSQPSGVGQGIGVDDIAAAITKLKPEKCTGPFGLFRIITHIKNTKNLQQSEYAIAKELAKILPTLSEDNKIILTQSFTAWKGLERANHDTRVAVRIAEEQVLPEAKRRSPASVKCSEIWKTFTMFITGQGEKKRVVEHQTIFRQSDPEYPLKLAQRLENAYKLTLPRRADVGIGSPVPAFIGLLSAYGTKEDAEGSSASQKPVVAQIEWKILKDEIQQLKDSQSFNYAKDVKEDLKENREALEEAVEFAQEFMT